MKAASIKELKLELNIRSQKDLIELCMRLSKFKKENKELLSYLLFEEGDEASYIKNVKAEIKDEFKLINTASFFYIKKSVRKILRNVKKYIKYSKKKETEVELLMYFCYEFKNTVPYIKKNITLDNIYKRQIEIIIKAISFLHEDLQYDYSLEIKALI